MGLIPTSHRAAFDRSADSAQAKVRRSPVLRAQCLQASPPWTHFDILKCRVSHVVREAWASGRCGGATCFGTGRQRMRRRWWARWGCRPSPRRPETGAPAACAPPCAWCPRARPACLSLPCPPACSSRPRITRVASDRILTWLRLLLSQGLHPVSPAVSPRLTTQSWRLQSAYRNIEENALSCCKRADKPLAAQMRQARDM